MTKAVLEKSETSDVKREIFNAWPFFRLTSHISRFTFAACCTTNHLDNK